MIGNWDNFSVIVIVIVGEKIKVIVIGIDGQVIDNHDNSLLHLYYIIIFSLDYSHQFNLCHLF